MATILFKNGKIVDGTGSPFFYGDVLIKDGIIKGMGKINKKADQVIDVQGKVIAPGFIDIHTHSDTVYLLNNLGKSKIEQGVTTEVLGNCGFAVAPAYGVAANDLEDSLRKKGIELSWASFGEYLEALEKARPAANLAGLVGHGTLRKSVVGNDEREATPQELKEMEKILGECHEEGAFGFSSGLLYAPSCYGNKEEFAALAKITAKYGGIYATHMRNESDRLLESVQESAEVGQKTGVAVQVSHHKVGGEKNWGAVKETLSYMQELRQNGLDITCDVYPYIATSTSLSALLPSWAHNGGTRKMLGNLKNEDFYCKVREGLNRSESEQEFEKIMVSFLPEGKNKKFEGQRISEIATELGMHGSDALIYLVMESEAEAAMIRFGMCEEDVQEVLRNPLSMVGSDGSAITDREGRPHPRNFGTFPRVLGFYSREQGTFTLEEAVYKMSGMPAWRLGLWKRGLLREGFAADITVFDPEVVVDRSTFTEPFQSPVGIDYVMVNGELVLINGKQVESFPGQILKRGRT